MGSGTRRSFETELLTDTKNTADDFQPTALQQEAYSTSNYELAAYRPSGGNHAGVHPVGGDHHGGARPVVVDHHHHNIPPVVIDHHRPVVDNHRPVIEHRPPVVDHHRPPVVDHHRPPVVDHHPPVVDHHRPPVVIDRHPPVVVHDNRHHENTTRIFVGGHHWNPPNGCHWGWHDEARFNRGWDVWFFQQSPNYELWHREIAQEARNIGILLDTGNGPLAAQRLQNDLIRLRPDRYAQNELISQVFRNDRKGFGADLVLGRWDPLSGGWSQGFIRQSPYGPVYPIYY